ncbi:ARM repeat-containing protein [Punctularia strigosozonata HHB-11173 SS5]|uniref:ARM repeat-containing protein n=1 Tax=Punctularia strigosozonata (strain HHB-11173) TaxID=741275 RepID=UPI0004417A54|nr:ARM repeat-containing protein [Punctularia strigosozonata HHB-11173 SS5]EIN06595.1 ARM repeat-containing protein [Punctularia strigosozonata HHB-11173 SS5]
MSTWAPDQGGLQTILQTISDSMDTHNAAIQRAITQKLSEFTRVADYIAYLAYILAHMPAQHERIRTIAGYLLKNNAKLILQSSPEVAAFVKTSILQAFNDPSVLVRNAAGQDIVAFLGTLEPKNWPECLQHLFATLDSADADQQEAAFNALEKACEDYPRKMDIDINGQRPLDFMIPKFMQLSEHPSAKMRSHAIACLAYFVPIQSQSLWAHLDAFIACLFKRASDDDPGVRRHVCQALVLLLASRPEKLMPEMHNVAEYMLYSTKDQNENVALEACEFWLTFAEDSELAPYLAPLLPKVGPVLLDCMVYGEDDLLWLEADVEDDSAVPDKESDIRPRHYGGKSHGFEHEAVNGGEGTQAKKGAYGEEQLDEEEDDDYDDDDDFADEMSTEWNLRKCAAAALDVLAVRFGQDLLNVLLEPLKAKLWSQDWLQRESAILALGAMAEGCIEVIEPHLPTLIPYLLSTLNDPKPLVRSISCWTLGRYASWCAQGGSEEHKNQFFIPTMEGLLRMVLDNNKRVQEAGCSAFATLEEDAGQELAPYLEPVLRNLVFAFEKYQHKNMLILYDAVGTLADAVGRAMANPTYVDILMPPLTKRWAKLKDDDEDLVPLLECLASVTIAMGPAFLPYCGPVFERCQNIIHHSLLQYQQYQQNSDLDEPDRQFLVVALDLLSGLTQGLGMALEPFLAQSQLFNLLTVCLKHPQAPVRQSAYALVGDMAMGCFPLLRPHMPGIMSELIEQLDPEPKVEFISACNNAAWSVGEVALRYGRDDPEFRQWVNPLISRLVPILLHPKAPRSLHENAAVSIGRIGLVHPTIVAPYLNEFAQQWCQALYEIRDNEEKDSAFRGFCTLVQTNPSGIAKSILWFCNAIVRWNTPSPELQNMFQQLLSGFKQADPAGWQAQVATFPPVIQERLVARYNV